MCNNYDANLDCAVGNCNSSAEVETPFGLSALVIIRFDPSAHLILTKLVSICE